LSSWIRIHICSGFNKRSIKCRVVTSRSFKSCEIDNLCNLPDQYDDKYNFIVLPSFRTIAAVLLRLGLLINVTVIATEASSYQALLNCPRDFIALILKRAPSCELMGYLLLRLSHLSETVSQGRSLLLQHLYLPVNLSILSYSSCH
jgi:hypothetical protein